MISNPAFRLCQKGGLIAFVMVAFLLISFVPLALAEDEGIWTRNKLTGDWMGGRTYLSDHGLDFNLRLSEYWQNVSSGGVDTNAEWGGTMDYRLTVDTNKLLGTWKGFSVDMHARTRWGQDVQSDAGGLTLPNTGMLMPAPGSYHDTDITGLSASQYFPFFFDRLGLLTIGKNDIIDLVTGFFPNIAYGQEGFSNADSMLTVLPWLGPVQGLSLYGGTFVTVNKDYQLPESGVVVLGTKNVATEWSSLSDSFDDGVFLFGFHRFLWKMDDKVGYFMPIAGGSTRAQVSNDPHDFVDIPGQGIESTETHKPWNVGFYLYQDIWQAKDDSTRKANITLGGTAGPDNPQFAQYNLFANVESFGLMKSRPHDRMGVAVWYNWLSDNFTDLVSPVVDLQDLWGMEVYYNFAINKWAHLSPDLQLLQNAQEDDDVAVVSGVRLTIDF